MRMHKHANAMNVQNESVKNANVKSAVVGIAEMVEPQTWEFDDLAELKDCQDDIQS